MFANKSRGTAIPRFFYAPPLYNVAMARAWYFPRWRHLLMQMVMWLVLGASMVLAAMLDHHLRQGQIIDFSPTVTDDSLSFRLPSTWKTWTRRNDADVTEHVATDSVAGIVRTL